MISAFIVYRSWFFKLSVAIFYRNSLLSHSILVDSYHVAVNLADIH